MKTKLIIEIETPDANKCNVLPLELVGKDESEWTEEEKEEAKDMAEEYPEELHDYIVNFIKDFFDERLEEESIDAMEEVYIEDYDSFKDYGVNVKVSKQ